MCLVYTVEYKGMTSLNVIVVVVVIVIEVVEISFKFESVECFKLFK